MQTFVISDNEALSARVRERLVRSGHECPDGHVVPLKHAQGTVDLADLVVVVMTPNPDNALQILRDLRSAISESPNKIYLIAVGPLDARLMLRAQDVADKYIPEEDVDSALDKAVADLQGATREKPGHLVSVLAPSGGSGSSVVASNLAVMLAKEHRQCALFDLKLGAGVIDALLDVKPTHTLADLCSNSERMDRGMFERLLVKHPSGVYLMAPPTSFNDLDLITPQGVRQAITLARGLYPYVVADLDRTFMAEQVETLAASNLILMVLRLDFTSLRNTRQVLDHLEQLQINRSNVQLVINRHGQPREVRLNQAEEALGMRVLKVIPDDPRAINKSINNGVPVVLDQPRIPVAKALIDLARDVHALLERAEGAGAR